MVERISRWWCAHFHHQISNPVMGCYVCLKCLRIYRAEGMVPDATTPPPRMTAPRPAYDSKTDAKPQGLRLRRIKGGRAQ
jgi:hypothetical protein